MDAAAIAVPLSRETAPTRVVMSSAEYTDDDRLAVLEEAAIDGARIAQLEDLVRCATVLEDTIVHVGLSNGGVRSLTVLGVSDGARRQSAKAA